MEKWHPQYWGFAFLLTQVKIWKPNCFIKINILKAYVIYTLIDKKILSIKILVCYNQVVLTWSWSTQNTNTLQNKQSDSDLI